MNDNTLHWWPLCFSETISTGKPTALFWGSQELSVFRDKNNIVRAVEDRCPHRRAPLSLGRITAEGHIQCGYHGWTFNGESGDISAFPNLDEGERLPKCSIKTFALYEHRNVVYIASSNACLDKDITPTGLDEHSSFQGSPPSALSRFYGSATYGLAHQECVVAFLDNPAVFMDILGVDILEKAYGDPKINAGVLTTERAARWNLLGESRFYLGPLRHRADFPLSVQIISVLVTGETTLKLCRQNGQIMAAIQLTFTPTTRGMTTAHWRSTINTKAWGMLTPLLSLHKVLQRSPLKLKQQINASDLTKTLANAGEDWRSASIPHPINEEAVC